MPFLFRTDLPANELVQRHKIASCGSSSSINSPPSSVSPRLKTIDCTFETNGIGNNSTSINLSIGHVSPYRRSLSHTSSVNSTLAFDDKR